ncbi:MAG: type pilus assembly protein PilM [Firmicutes bacterium]|nr:type pilus assembly protein PilM [Bacillota bacterium]
MSGERWKKFTRLFRRRITTLVGVDFGQGAVKVAEVALSGGKPYLRTLAIVTAPAADGMEQLTSDEQDLSGEAEVLEKMLTQALALSGVRAKDAVLAVGGRRIFVREVNFPKLPPEELAVAIKWDIPKYVPYEPDSYEFDYAITGSVGEELKVLVVAAPKAVVSQLTTIVRAAGLNPVAVDIEPLAVYRTLNNADNSLVLDIGAVSTQISLFQQGNPVFTRVVALAGGRLETVLRSAALENAAAEAEGLVEAMGQEVRRTIQFFTQQNKGAVIDKVILTGLAEVDKMVELLAERLDLPVAGHNPLTAITLNPSIDAEYAGKVGPQLAVAVGLAMRGDEL